VVGRGTGAIVLRVVERTDAATLTGFVASHTADGTVVYTDEWCGYHGLPAADRRHATVNHTPGQREWARDDDGDGVREVHDDTLEGLWAALRTFLRPFRGVSKRYLSPYGAVFHWAYNRKVAGPETLRLLLDLTPDAP
jgi:transposase